MPDDDQSATTRLSLDLLGTLLGLGDARVTGVEAEGDDVVLTLAGPDLPGAEVEGDWYVDQFGASRLNFWKPLAADQGGAPGPAGAPEPPGAPEGGPGLPGPPGAAPDIPEVPGQGNRRRGRGGS